MLCTILKTFAYSTNGTNSKTAQAGTEADIPDALVAGLAAEGYLKAAGAKMQAPAANKMQGPVENKDSATPMAAGDAEDAGGDAEILPPKATRTAGKRTKASK